MVEVKNGTQVEVGTSSRYREFANRMNKGIWGWVISEFQSEGEKNKGVRVLGLGGERFFLKIKPREEMGGANGRGEEPRIIDLCFAPEFLHKRLSSLEGKILKFRLGGDKVKYYQLAHRPADVKGLTGIFVEELDEINARMAETTYNYVDGHDYFSEDTKNALKGMEIVDVSCKKPDERKFIKGSKPAVM